MIKRLIGTFLRACLSACWLCGLSIGFAVAAPYTGQPLLAIVIDDLGDNREHGIDAVNLPGKLTYAFLPHTPHVFELAQNAHLLGKEVILHAPMENKAGLKLGPGALQRHHSAVEISRILRTDFASIPHAAGMNNHMGSVLTADYDKMKVVMAEVKKRQKFFIDSMTTPKTVAWKVARETGVPYLTRDVFLDNEQEWDYIHQQFKQALRIAVAKGHAVLIGHPYPETIDYLAQTLPLMEELGIRLVTASELLELRSPEQFLLVKK